MIRSRKLSLAALTGKRYADALVAAHAFLGGSGKDAAEPASRVGGGRPAPAAARTNPPLRLGRQVENG